MNHFIVIDGRKIFHAFGAVLSARSGLSPTDFPKKKNIVTGRRRRRAQTDSWIMSFLLLLYHWRNNIPFHAFHRLFRSQKIVVLRKKKKNACTYGFLNPPPGHASQETHQTADRSVLPANRPDWWPLTTIRNTRMHTTTLYANRDEDPVTGTGDKLDRINLLFAGGRHDGLCRHLNVDELSPSWGKNPAQVANFKILQLYLQVNSTFFMPSCGFSPPMSPR